MKRDVTTRLFDVQDTEFLHRPDRRSGAASRRIAGGELGQVWYGSRVIELKLTIDHVSLSVADLGRAKNFYSKALAPLGMEIVHEVGAEQSGSVGFVGFGIGRKGSFWVTHKGRQTPTTHICFRASTRASVRDFYAAALEAGAKDNGGPGVRPEYHKAYFAAFVLCPEGHNIEAVCFEEES